VPVESLLAGFTGTGLPLGTLPARLVWHPVLMNILTAAAMQSPKANFLIIMGK
jgi:hypothetical protein